MENVEDEGEGKDEGERGKVVVGGGNEGGWW